MKVRIKIVQDCEFSFETNISRSQRYRLRIVDQRYTDLSYYYYDFSSQYHPQGFRGNSEGRITNIVLRRITQEFWAELLRDLKNYLPLFEFSEDKWDVRCALKKLIGCKEFLPYIDLLIFWEIIADSGAEVQWVR